MANGGRSGVIRDEVCFEVGILLFYPDPREIDFFKKQGYLSFVQGTIVPPRFLKKTGKKSERFLQVKDLFSDLFHRFFL